MHLHHHLSNHPVANQSKKNKLTYGDLSSHLYENYDFGESPEQHEEKIERILGVDRARNFIDNRNSEYFKILTHFALLSRLKQGWVNLLNTQKSSKVRPYYSVATSQFPYFKDLETAKLNDAIIYCLYKRLIEGMTETERENYQVLLPTEVYTCGFDNLLVNLDAVIQYYFCSQKQIINKMAADEGNELLPDAGIENISQDIRELIYKFLGQENVSQGYSNDILHASLIKFSSINRAINDVDAILRIHKDVLFGLPDEIQSLLPIKSEDEILPAVLSLFDESDKNIPADLIQCAQLVCDIYISSSAPSASDDDIRTFQSNHRSPLAVAVSAALLCHDYLHKAEINCLIRGESNPFIPVYDTLSLFSKLEGINGR